MNLGILVNRLVVGFTFAFSYQFVVGIATSLIDIPLTGNVQDLISGIEKIDSEHGFWFIVWWIISTVIITSIALLLVKYRKFISPYKEEKDINIPLRITALTAVVIGSILSFLFFLLDIIIGSFVQAGTQTDVQAIYQAALSGDFAPLFVSLIFSLAAGFIVVGIAGKTAKVKELTKDISITKLADFGKLITKKSKNSTTTADTVGLHPGALVHVGKKKVEKIKFSILEYDEDEFKEIKEATLEDCLEGKEKQNVTWINISGIHDPKVIENFGSSFGLHPLVQSDLMNTELRPKFEVHNDYIFIILKIPHFENDGIKLVQEQISIVIGKNYVLTFQETEGDIFDHIRNRIKEKIGEIRKLKSDFLSYTLADMIVDNFFGIMEKLGTQTELLEEELMSNPNPNTLKKIQMLKRETILLRKIIWPIREVIDTFERSSSPFIDDNTKRYLRDVYSHSIQVMDTIESQREMVGGMLDTYLSSVSNKMNETMKTLTIIASIFIPITFIAGIYGTNFEYIPELAWEGSYFVMISSMAIISIIMIVWFRKRQWL